MNENVFLTDYFNECANFISNQEAIQSCKDAKQMIINTRDSGGKLMFAGNGASASIANHASLDFTKQAKIKSVNFNESTLITAFANDFGYENWLTKAIEYYGEQNDTLILISSSGQSSNIINAAKHANQNHINLITFTGFDIDNPLTMCGDINFWLNSKSYNIIEGIHQIWLMSICDLIIGKKEYSVK